MKLKQHLNIKHLFLYNVTRPYRKFAVLLVALSFLASVFDGLSVGMMVPLLSSLQQMQETDKLPRLLRFITDLFANFPVAQQVLYAGGVLILAVLAKNMFLGISTALGTWLTTKLTTRMRFQVVDVLLQVDIAFFQNAQMGHLLEKILANTMTIETIFKRIIDYIVNLSTLIVLMGMLLILSWQLTLVTFLFALIITFAISRYIRLITRIGQKSALSNRDLNGALAENISGIRIIKYFAKESKQSKLLKDLIEKNRRLRFRLRLGNLLVQNFTEGMGIIALGILFSIAFLNYDMNSKLLLTQLLPFMYVLTRLIPVIKELNHSRSHISSKWPFISMVEELIRRDNKPFLPDGEKPYKGLIDCIEFKNVTFAYEPGDAAALKAANFSIPHGKTTAFVGESGAGKSTIINLLLRLYDPQEGDILIDGQSLKQFRSKSFRETIGIVSQETFIFNDSVYNNIAFGALTPPSKEAIVAAAKKAGAHEFITQLPEGYDTQLGERGTKLSGGQRQRISIARAIIKDPEILILDEATSSLDNHTEKLIHEAIADLSRDRTVIIIAHRLSTIQGADQIIVLKNARVVEIGKEQTLMAQQGEYYKLARVY